MSAANPATEYTDRLNLAELVARIERQQEEGRKFVAEQHKLMAEREKLAAKRDKLAAEERKLDRDRGLAPWVTVVALVGGIGGTLRRAGDLPAPGGRSAVTPEALRASLARLGLTQSGAARMLGVRVTTMQRWCAGDREVPPPAERLFWAMERDPGLLAALRDRAEAAHTTPAVP
jgi:hypothetical protein